VKDEKSNAPIDPIVEGLIDRRTVVMSGEMTDESTSRLGQRLLSLQMKSSDPINLIIDSGGGSTFAALQLCDLITTMMTAPVRGIALGSCGSAATFIMLHCHERISTPYSRFLVHSGTKSRISIPVNQTSSEHLEQLLKDVRTTEETVLQLYVKRLTPREWKEKNHSNEERRAYVRKLIARGDQNFNAWITAEEAVEVGLIQSIVTEKLDIFSK
jgi:ATP-dependent Clp protease protease subunit